MDVEWPPLELTPGLRFNGSHLLWTLLFDDGEDPGFDDFLLVVEALP